MPGPGRLWLIGVGNMGGALLARWRANGLDLVGVDPRLGSAIPADGTPDIIVLAVKPQIWWAASEALAARAGPDTLVVSIMAGVTIASLRRRFPDARLARAMPNTPAALGRGVTGLFLEAADAGDRGRLDALFAAAGATVWLDRETDFDALTAVSGSGPGYVFAFIEALAAAGEAAGLSAEVAAHLARATVTGAAALADADDRSPADLRTAVTSPNGTTAAGLAVLTPGLGTLMRDTVAAAQLRSRELGRAE
jgi:pyrroline-5-carboxylate reductase